MRIKNWVIATFLLVVGFPLIYAANPTFKGVFKSTASGPAVDVADLTGAYVQNAVDEPLLVSTASKKVFYLQHRPIRKIIDVKVNGASLPTKDPITGIANWCYHPSNAWISFRTALTTPDQATITYAYSTRLDMVATGLPGGACQVSFKNNGGYNFTLNPSLMGTVDQATLNATGPNNTIAAIDIDGDGDVDVLANSEGSSDLFLNSGVGTFSLRGSDPGHTRPFSFDVTSPGDVAYADYDNDGDIDLVQAMGNNPTSGVRLIQNTANGTSHISWSNDNASALIVGNIRTVDFGDADGDGDLDILAADWKDVATFDYLRIWQQDVVTGPYLLASGGPTMPFRKAIMRVLADAPTTYVDSMAVQFDSTDAAAGPILGSIAVDENYVYAFTTTNDVAYLKKLNKKDFSLVTQVSDVGIPINERMINAHIAVDDTYIYLACFDRAYNSGVSNNKLQRRRKSDLGLDQNFVGSQSPASPDFLGDPNYNDGVNTGGPRGIAVDDQYVYFWIWDFSAANASQIQRRPKLNLASSASNYPVDPTAALVMKDPANPFPIYGNSLAVDNLFLYIPAGTNVQKRKKSDLSLSSKVVTAGTSYASVTTDAGYPSYGTTAATKIFIGLDTSNSKIEIWSPSPLAITNGPSILSNRGSYFDYSAGVVFLAYDPVPGGLRLPIFRTLPGYKSVENHMPASNVQFADFDNDGDLDFVAVADKIPYGNSLYNTRIYRNNGNFNFTLAWTFPGAVRDGQGVGGGDLDGDGYQDLVFSYASGSPRVEAYLNNHDSNLTFTKVWGSDTDPDPSYNGVVGRRLKLADMNNDGKLDIVVAGVGAGPGMGGPYIFGQQGVFRKLIRIKTKTKKNGVGIEITETHAVNADGSMGALISREVH